MKGLLQHFPQLEGKARWDPCCEEVVHPSLCDEFHFGGHRGSPDATFEITRVLGVGLRVDFDSTPSAP